MPATLSAAIQANQLPYTKPVNEQMFKPLSEVGKLNGKPVLAPDNQIAVTGLWSNAYTYTINPPIPANSFTGQNTVTVTLPEISAEQCRSVRLDLYFNESGGSSSVTMCAPALAIQRIDLINQNGKVGQSWFGETLYISPNLYMSKTQFDMMAPLLGLTTSWAPATSGNGSCVISSGGYQQFSIPLFGFFEAVHPIMNLMKSGLQLKFYIRNAVVSGSGTLNLNKANLVLMHNDISDSNMEYQRMLYASSVLKYRFLDRINTSLTLTVTKNQKNLIPLNNLNAYVAFGVVMIRSSVSATTNGYTTFSALTNAQNEQTQAVIGIQGADNNDILNKGNQLNQNDLLYTSSQYFDNQLFITNQPLYPIIFCSSVKRALMGDASSGGFMFSAGNPYVLTITPDSNWSNGTYTVDVWWYYYSDIFVENGRFNKNSEN